MNTRHFSSPAARLCVASLAIFLVFLAALAPRTGSADDRGTIGIVVHQLYSESVPNHRGPLAILKVVEDSPAAKAGIHCSDFILAINGVPVPGREYSDIMDKDIDGPIGGTVRLTIARFDGSQSEFTLVRATFPPHVNPLSDPFTYRVPGSWANDPRYSFPLPWATALRYHGFEDLYFAPNFNRTDSPEYHSYLFFMSLEGAPITTAKKLQADMLTYFRGLAKERAGTYKFTPDLSKVAVTYKQDSAVPQRFASTSARAFSGTAAIYDTHGKIITLNSEVVMLSGCGNSNNTIFFFGMSLEARDGPMWKEIDAVRDTFHCRP